MSYVVTLYHIRRSETTVSDRRVYDLSGLGRELFDRGVAVSLCSLERTVFDLNVLEVQCSCDRLLWPLARRSTREPTLSEQAEAIRFRGRLQCGARRQANQNESEGGRQDQQRLPCTLPSCEWSATNNAGSKCKGCPLDGNREWEIPVDTDTNIHPTYRGQD